MLFCDRADRGVAQFGSALGSGPRGRGFDSRFSDQLPKNIDGGCGEVANTSGCEPDIREFDPPQPPQYRIYWSSVEILGFFDAVITVFIFKMHNFAW